MTARFGSDAPPAGVRAVAGAVIVNLAAGPLFAWDSFTGAVARVHGVPDTVLGLVLSVGIAVFAVAVLVGGPATDRVSPRLLVVAVAAVAVLGLAVAALATSVVGVVLGFGVLLGAASGLGYAVASRVAAAVSWRPGLVFGLAVGAFGAGPIVVAPAAAVLLDRVGLAGTFAALGAMTGSATLLGAALLPRRPPRRSPRQRGEPAAGERDSAASTRLPWPAIVGLCAVFGLGSAPALAAFGYAGEIIGDAQAATLAVVLLSIGNLAGRVISGPVSDVIGRAAALHLNSALLVASCLLLVVAAGGGIAALVAITALGFQYGAISTLTAVTTADVAPAERFGSGYGIVVAGWGIAGLTAPVGVGALSTALGWRPVFVVFVGLAALAWLAVALTPLRGRVAERVRRPA